MNWIVILIGAAAFAALFTVLVFQTTGKDKTVQIHNYPPEIQEEYFKTHARIPTQPLSKQVVLKKSLGIVFFAAILVVIARLAGAETFWEGFGVAFGLMVFIGLYDTLFLDWVLFANMKRFRLEGTEHMDREYHQKWFHFKGMLFPGILFAAIVGVVAGLAILVLC